MPEEEAVEPAVDTVVVYQGNDDLWYWRRVAPNNRIIAVGGEGYDNQDDCIEIATELGLGTRGQPAMVVEDSSS